MRLRGTAWLAAIVLIPIQAMAQGRPFAEVGTRAGLAIVSAGGATNTIFGIPGEGIMGGTSIYTSWFQGQKLMIEDELGTTVFHSGGLGGGTVTGIGLSGGAGYLLKGPDTSSVWFGGNLALNYAKAGAVSNTGFALGAKVGYRMLLKRTSFALRLEAGFRKWLNNAKENEFTIGVGLGGILHKARAAARPPARRR